MSGNTKPAGGEQPRRRVPGSRRATTENRRHVAGPPAGQCWWPCSVTPCAPPQGPPGSIHPTTMVQGLSWGELHQHQALGLVATQGFVQTLPGARGVEAVTAGGSGCILCPPAKPLGSPAPALPPASRLAAAAAGVDQNSTAGSKAPLKSIYA